MHEELWILPCLEHSIEQSIMLLTKQAHFNLMHQLSFGMYTRSLKRIYSFSLWHERAIAKHTDSHDEVLTVARVRLVPADCSVEHSTSWLEVGDVSTVFCSRQ
jgi:hypothetical protein